MAVVIADASVISLVCRAVATTAAVAGNSNAIAVAAAANGPLEGEVSELLRALLELERERFVGWLAGFMVAMGCGRAV